MRVFRAFLISIIVLSSFEAHPFKGGTPSFSDREIESAIKQRLAMDGRIDPKEIEVKVNNRNVILTGTVDTMTEKGLAENLVVSTYGVQSLINELAVHPALTKDGVLRRAVEEALKSTPVLQRVPVETNVNEGVVTLRGAVEKPRQSRAAEDAAKAVHGVKKVVNLIKVTGKPRPDKEIEPDVVFYLQSSSLVDLDQVEVSVIDGIVRLKGTVDNLAHKFVVANEVEKIHGVRAVEVSELKVATSREGNGAKLK
jgi:osmotically-inducible protein OsmY